MKQKVDNTASLQDNSLTKENVDEITVSKWQIVKTTSWWNNKLMKYWKVSLNDELTKLQIDEIENHL